MRIETQIASSDSKPSVAVHKFTSCDGCQLAFLNLGEQLLTLSQLVEFKHFVEAGIVAKDETVDIAIVEGSISTADEELRIKRIRENSKYLITIGACATAGGLQALRNFNDVKQWQQAIYASPEYVESLSSAFAIKNYVRVDFELWGCPVSSRQVLATIHSLLSGVSPVSENEKICLECKRLNNVCVMVSRGDPCMGPVTQTGCGSICPAYGRGCYACFGPAENSNTESMASQFCKLGLNTDQIKRRFLFINNSAPIFSDAAMQRRAKCDE